MAGAGAEAGAGVVTGGGADRPPTTDPPPEAGYGTDAGGFAVDQAQAAQTTSSGGENVPNGTATASSET